MGKSADIPRVLEPIRIHIRSLGREAWPPCDTHTTTHLSSPQAGLGTTFGAMVVCQCANYNHTSGLDVHRHKDVQQGWAEMAEMAGMAEQCVGVAVANRRQMGPAEKLSWKTIRRPPRQFLKRRCLESLGLVAGDWRAVQQSACRCGCAVGEAGQTGQSTVRGSGP